MPNPWNSASWRLLGFCVALGALAVAYLWLRERPPLAAGSTCRLHTWTLRQRQVRLDLETGPTVHVPTSTACVVLDDSHDRTLVRVTEGPYKGMSGWVSRASVAR